jgi:hypothetical protein
MLVVDYGTIGAVAGFILSLVELVALMVLAWRIERHVESDTAARTACLLRMTAILGLALGTGVGYLIGRAIGS